MTGTFLNIITVIVGGSIGLFLGTRISDRVRHSIVTALGLLTVLLGVQMFLKSQNVLIVLLSLIIGILLGEWWHIEEGLQILGQWIENRFNRNNDNNSQARFVRGFLTSSLVFCVGPMTILGAIQDGLTGDYSLLAIKAFMDGFAALAFASSLGVGVLFSIIVLLLYQGGISIMAAQLQALVTPSMMNEMSAVGGVILLGLSIGSLLELRPIRSGSMLPSLIFAPIVTAIFELINWLK